MSLSVALDTHAAPGFLNRVAGLVHTHRSRLLAYARKRGLNAEDALDVVQEGFLTFLRLPQALTVAEPDALKLLTVLVRHQLQNRRRQNARTWPSEAAPAMHHETSEELVARAEELARVNGCILRMNALQGDVIRLSLLDERPYDEVAAVLGISEGYVRVLLHRAREHVRNCEDRL
ncbi:MAG TPA: RNA polymerase sigma factor [Polyangiales bacterium]|nr:RNA polymerase sigma factor [Polyangiales bacterium]